EIVEQAIAVHLPGVVHQLVAEGDGVGELQVEVVAEHVEVRAAAIREVGGDRLRPRRLLHRDAAQAVAGEGPVVGIEAGEGRHALAFAAAVYGYWYVRDEEVFVIEDAREEQNLAVIPLVGECAGELPAVVRRKLGVAHALRIAVEAAEADEPVLCERAAVEAIDAVAVIGANRESEVAVGVRSTLAEDEVRR